MCKQWVVAGTFFHCDECQTFDACEACVAKGRQEVLPSGRAAVIVEEGEPEPYVHELHELADGGLDETDAISDSESGGYSSEGSETEGDDAE